MRELPFLFAAAVLEVAGDALIRRGLRGGGVGLMLAGVAVLAAYGLLVNLTRLDFGRLMGIYVVLFFAVSQVISVLIFKERLRLPVAIGGLLIVAGGAVMTAWR